MPESQAGYKYLLTYQYTSVIYDLTVEFCDFYKVTFLLDRQIKALEEKFTSEGGCTEKLFRKRLSRRSKS